MGKIESIIGRIVNDNIKFYNYSNKEVSLLSGINEINLSNLILGKEKITYKSSAKLASVFRNMKNNPSLLFDIYNKMLSQENINENEKDLINYLEENKENFNLLQKESQINELRKIFPGNSPQAFENFLLHSNASFSKYKDKPKAYLWVALMFNKYASENNKNSFKKSTGSSIINKVLAIFFSKTIFTQREKSISKFLYNQGIILRNGPFIPDSSMMGISFKKKNNRYIFLSDMYKREYRWLISLIHEMLHFYSKFATEEKIELEVINLIKKYIRKKEIINKDFEIFFKFKPLISTIPKDEYFTNLRNQTHQRISFGNFQDLLNF